LPFHYNIFVEKLLSQDYNTILHIARVAQADLEPSILRKRVLEELQKVFQANILTFFLIESKGRLSSPVLKDGDPGICQKYLDYYYQFDPMSPWKGVEVARRVLRYSDITPYSQFIRTEYYNDFLAPQPIHFGMFLYLSSPTELLGRISVFRPKRCEDFTEREVSLAKLFIPYLSFALENAKLYKKVKEERDFFKTVDEWISNGILILNEKLRPIFINQKANEFIALFKKSGILSGEEYLPKEILEDCSELMGLSKIGKITPLPKNRIIAHPPQCHFSFHSQIVHQNFYSESQTLLMISIKELKGVKINEKTLQETYCLTQRETEIVRWIAEGLKNAEIADRLFISELTVKKHIQNIFEKIGVKNRTSLVRKTLLLINTHPKI